MVYAGQTIKAAHQQDGTLANIGDMVYVRKQASETVTNSIVVQDDNDLQITLPVGNYNIDLYLHTSGIEAADIRVCMVFGGTTASGRQSRGAAEGTTDKEATLSISRGHGIVTEQVYGVDTTGTTVVHESFYLEVTVTGLFKVQWAQGTANATGTICSSASRMTITRVS